MGNNHTIECSWVTSASENKYAMWFISVSLWKFGDIDFLLSLDFYNITDDTCQVGCTLTFNILKTNLLII